jgi:CO/xanthine dehydrogenase Mo-binding subunit
MGGIGENLRRLEDRPLLLGEGRFADDISFAGQLHMRVVRSPTAHGRIAGIDVQEALAASGVAAIWTGADIADIPPISFRMTDIGGLERYRQPILAQGIVRYVGEPVAVVFADDPYAAEDAAGLVFIDIEETPALVRAVDPPVLFKDAIDTEAAIIRKGYGDLDAAFAAAAHVVTLDLAVGRHSGIPMETRGAVARFNNDLQRLEMYGAAKVPHANRAAMAAMLGLSRTGLELFEGHVGGGFGIRGEVYPEDVLVCLAALRLRRPVKWVEDRREHMMAANQSRDQVHHIRAAVDADGLILAIDDEFWVNQGAYVRTHAATVADLTAAMLPGPYCVPAYRCVGHIRLTNKTPAGTYRGPGRYEGTFVRERLVDAVAAKIGLDRIEVRRRNLIARRDIPFHRGIEALGTELVYDAADFEGLLNKLIAAIDLPALENRLAERRAAGEQVGWGLGYFVEKSGLGPFDDVALTLDATGELEIVSGAASIGQGVETALAQICETELGVSTDRMRVIHGQTDRIARGMGAFASRVTVMAGSAVALASRQMRARLLAKAAEMLQRPAADLTMADGAFTGGPASVSIGAVAAACAADDGTPSLVSKASFEAHHMTYPYGVHLAVVRIDPETFGVAVERFIVAYDVGRAVNPMLVRGQIAGGAVQGIGGALYEEFLYSDEGQPMSTSFADYLMPTSMEVPAIEVILLEDAPTPLNPLGVKGAGEGGISAAGAAVAAAVDDALGGRVPIARLPLTPMDLRALCGEV